MYITKSLASDIISYNSGDNFFISISVYLGVSRENALYAIEYSRTTESILRFVSNLKIVRLKYDVSDLYNMQTLFSPDHFKNRLNTEDEIFLS